MRRLILFMHTSLDGFVAGPNGEMDWIKVNEELFDFAGEFTDRADTALYGRVTFQLMDSYWPTAADKPNASKHDIEHSQWYNKVHKIVLSRTMQQAHSSNTVFLADNIPEHLNKIKQGTGKDILMFGSPTAAHTLTKHDSIDDYWLFVNPVLLGKGIPLFADLDERKQLTFDACKTFPSGVIGLHYERKSANS